MQTMLLQQKGTYEAEAKGANSKYSVREEQTACQGQGHAGPTAMLNMLVIIFEKGMVLQKFQRNTAT